MIDATREEAGRAATDLRNPGRNIPTVSDGKFGPVRAGLTARMRLYRVPIAGSAAKPTEMERGSKAREAKRPFHSTLLYIKDDCPGLPPAN